MARTIRLRSLAKINLDLRVLHKRSDGYHELRTIFQTISLADRLEVEYRRGRTSIAVDSSVNIPDNIMVKAADCVLRATRSTGQVGIRLIKKIPMGGGLGGGSSNAAAVLLALPFLIGKPLKLETLMELAAELGSDVPFFLLGGTAVGLGRGTELYPLPDVPARPALIIAPGIQVSTPDAYRALGRGTAPDAPPDYAFQAAAWRLADGAMENFVNDFETVVFRQHPQLELLKGKLLKLDARPALMSGSGSTLFGIFRSREMCDRAVRSLRREFAGRGVEALPVSLVSRRRYRSLWRRQLGVSLENRLWLPQDRYAK